MSFRHFRFKSIHTLNIKIMIHEIKQDGLGICGFTSIIQLLIDNKVMTQSEFEKNYGNTTAYAEERLDIQIAHDSAISSSSKVATALNQSLKFTGEFGPKFDISIEKLLQTKEWDWMKSPGFALTAESIADYLTRKYGLKVSFKLQDFDSDISLLKDKPHDPGIYGIKRLEAKHIQHWVYVDNAGNLMTWGLQNQSAYVKMISSGFDCVSTRILVNQ